MVKILLRCSIVNMLMNRFTASLVAALWLAAAGLCRADVATPAISTNQLVPGANDGRIAFVTARMLEQNHYLRHPLDDEFSEKFYVRYLETLDPMRMHFTQSDLAGFNSYRTNLDDLTVEHGREADVSPAFKIFARFMERLSERTAYVEAMLKTNKFEFNTDEKILLDRRDAPYPRDLAEARKLWALRLRYEYLQEKLARTPDPNSTNSPATNTVTRAESKGGTNAAVQASAPKTVAEEITDVLTRRYERTLRLFREWDNDDVLEVYLSALAHIYDPHSDYLNKSQADNFAISMNLSLFGIGAELGSEDGYCVVRKLHPGPASRSKKIKEGDKIVAVAQGDAPPVDVVDMSLNKAVQLIRGPKDTEVRLTIIPADSPSDRKVVSLIRDEIKLEDQEAKAKVIEVPQVGGRPLRLGVIDLSSFYATVDLSGRRRSLLGLGGDVPTMRSTSVDVARLLQKLKKENISGVILDLRRNGGGSLEEAIKLTGLFIKDGPVVQVRGPDGPPLVEDDSDDGALYTGPLIVLTSRFSASASEILAGALQDYGRALVVGDLSTHGKGTVQNVTPLRPWVRGATATNDPGALKMTIRKFYRAGGASTQLKGVLSDIVLPSVLNYSKDVGEGSLDNALSWDTIPSADFERLNMVAPYLSDLLRRSSARIATNQDFVYIRQDIDLFRKLQADKTVSLNEKERLQEKEEADVRNKAREKERLARKNPELKIYDLTLENIDQPGLPLPERATNAVGSASGNATNAVKTAAATGTDEDAEDSKAPAVDPTLDEAERILADYIGLMSDKTMIADHDSGKTTSTAP